MSALLVADFDDAGTLVQAARWAKSAGYPLADAFSPFPLDGMPEILGETSTRLRVWMFVGGLAVAALAYGTEYWSAVYDFPIDSGGRPRHSWPAFVRFRDTSLVNRFQRQGSGSGGAMGTGEPSSSWNAQHPTTSGPSRGP